MRLAWGTTRTVLLIGRWAVKVPSCVEWRLFLLGLLANMQERNFSRCGWPELCPVLWSLPGGWLVVMRRARAMTRPEWDQFSGEGFAEREPMPGSARARLYVNAETWPERDGYRVPVERKMDSFGWVGQQLVAVDYGN